MTKDTTDLRLQGLKGYLHSTNLKKPEQIINHNLKQFDKIEEKLNKRYNLSNQVATYESVFETELLGQCKYEQYNLKRCNK